MPTMTQREALAALPFLRYFRTRGGLVADTFERLSGPPTVTGMLPTEQTQLMAAHALNRQHYMPYCKTCGKEVTFGELRMWMHADESGADHVAEQTSHPESHTAPAAGLRYIVTYQRVPLLWVLNDGTIVIPSVPEELARRQNDVRAALGPEIDPKFLRR